MSGSLKKVLLVDDDPDDQYLTQRALKATGFNIEIGMVENGKELMDFLRLNSSKPELLPDLILLDLNMPEMDGIATLRALRQIKVPKRIYTVVFTTSSSTLDINESYDQGADFFLTKPGNFNELTNSLRELCVHWFGDRH